jgi:hypothetical protein
MQIAYPENQTTLDYLMALKKFCIQVLKLKKIIYEHCYTSYMHVGVIEIFKQSRTPIVANMYVLSFKILSSTNVYSPEIRYTSTNLLICVRQD